MNKSVMSKTKSRSASVGVTWPDFDHIHNPHEHFAVSGWHALAASGAWDFDKMMRELPLSFSDSLVSVRQKDEMKVWNLGFQLGKNTVASLHRRGSVDSLLRVWAPSLEQARSQLCALQARYLSRSKRKARTTTIIVLSACPDLETRAVPVRVPVRNLKDIEMNYGTEFARWSELFVTALKSHDSGLTVLRGQPGTGKTSFVRYVCHRLRNHRFYYVPTDLFSLLTGPKALDFWLAQNAVYEKRKKVLVIEDAESLLMDRGKSDASVSDVLNLADGFLGDALKLHVICTTNASIQHLDPAIVRPGRLIANREFRRLSWAEANKLAQLKGIDLSPRESYSLAEVYGSSKLNRTANEPQKRIGFGAQHV
jgi:hypothetical protein